MGTGKKEWPQSVVWYRGRDETWGLGLYKKKESEDRKMPTCFPGGCGSQVPRESTN